MSAFLDFTHIDSLFWKDVLLGLASLTGLVFVLGAVFAFMRSEAKQAMGARITRLGWGLFFVDTALGVMLVVWRGLEVGHAPWQTLFEVLVFCAVLVFLSYLVVAAVTGMFRYRGPWLGIANLMTALALAAVVVLLIIATLKDKGGNELPPALKSYWMWPHVMAFIFSYATFAVGLVAVLSYFVLKLFIKERAVRDWLKGFDDFSFKIVAVGFPFMTCALMMGSLWGQEAWGNYWGWDSKEVSALISWLVYLVYLHMRLVGGWRGERLFVLLIVGALAIVSCFLVFSYLPESQSSLHKYAE